MLSDVDKTKKDTLYKQTRNSMKKYLIGLNGEENDHTAGITFKKDASVLYLNNRGRGIRPQAGSWRPRVPHFVPRNPVRHGNFNSPRFRIPVSVPRNPVKEGKTMLCDICGAFTHLQVKCPYNPNN